MKPDESRPTMPNSSREKLTTKYFPFLLMIAAGLLLVVVSTFFPVNSSRSELLMFYMGVGGIVLIVLGGASSSLTYLSGGIRTRKPEEKLSNKTDHLSEILNSFKNQLEESQQNTVEEIKRTTHAKLSLSNEDRKELTSAIKKQITDNVAEDLLKSVSEKRKNVITSTEATELRAGFTEAKLRLMDEVASLSRRGNLNLVIGGVTTVLAVALLAYIVLNANPPIKADSRNLDALLWHYVPRLSVSIFIEIFSFFFLKLYRNSLEEIKYFQNEITNIESRMIGLEAAIYSDNKTSIENAVLGLSKTERNFRLQKGESTVELEKSKLDSQGAKDLVANLTSIINKNK